MGKVFLFGSMLLFGLGVAVGVGAILAIVNVREIQKQEKEK